MTVESFRAELERLTAFFLKNLTHFKSEAYDEMSLRNDYLIPFWRALGSRSAIPQPSGHTSRGVVRAVCRTRTGARLSEVHLVLLKK
jgi:hypothetical protein